MPGKSWWEALPRRRFYEAYVEFCRETGRRFVQSQTNFGADLADPQPDIGFRKLLAGLLSGVYGIEMDTSLVNGDVFLSLEHCWKTFSDRVGQHLEWPSGQEPS